MTAKKEVAAAQVAALPAEVEEVIHLIASAFERARGNETPEVFATTVVEHAKAIAEERSAKTKANTKTEKQADE